MVPKISVLFGSSYLEAIVKSPVGAFQVLKGKKSTESQLFVCYCNTSYCTPIYPTPKA